MAELEPQFLEAVDTSALELRSVFTPLQEGVVGPTDLKVSPGAVGLNIDVAAGVAFIQGDLVADQGRYRIRNDAVKNSTAFETGGIAANGTANPRIDQIIARVFDHTADGSGRRNWRLEVVTGVPTAGATLDNRSGAISDAAITAAGGSGWMRLADYIVPGGATTVIAGNMRDRRPWARGAAYHRIKTNANAVTSLTTFTAIDAALMAPRLELSGNPVLIDVHASMMSGAANVQVGANVAITRPDGVVENVAQRFYLPSGANAVDALAYRAVYVPPTPGSYIITPQFASGSGGIGATLEASATRPLFFMVEERTRMNGENT